MLNRTAPFGTVVDQRAASLARWEAEAAAVETGDGRALRHVEDRVQTLRGATEAREQFMADRRARLEIELAEAKS